MPDFAEFWRHRMDAATLKAMYEASTPVQLTIDSRLAVGWSEADKSACLKSYQQPIATAIADYEPGMPHPENIGRLYRIVKDLGLPELVEKHMSTARLYKPITRAQFLAASREMTSYINNRAHVYDARRGPNGVYEI